MIHEESEFSHVVFLQEEPFLAQLEFAPQPDATHQPYFDGVVQRQPGLAGQLGKRHFALRQPAIVARARVTGAEIEFVLRIHPVRVACVRPVVTFTLICQLAAL